MPGWWRARGRPRDVSRVLAALVDDPADPEDLARVIRVGELAAQRSERVGNLWDEAHGSELQETVAEAHAAASAPPWKGQWLHRLVLALQPERIVELGTAFGVGTAYLAAAVERNSHGEVVTVEGSGARQEVARSSLAAVGLDRRVSYLTGYFDEHLDALAGADLVYVDGNHYYKPTLTYVEQSLARSTPEVVIVLDDIAGYSEEMDRAWAELQRDRRFGAWGQVRDVGVLARSRDRFAALE